MKTTVVWGPPCSGKTTYVRNNRSTNSVTFDFDDVMAAFSGRLTHDTNMALIDLVVQVRDLLVGWLANGPELDEAWIITTRISDELRGKLAPLESEYHRMDTNEEQCLEWSEGRPDGTKDVIKEWFREMSDNQRTYPFQIRAVEQEGESPVIEGIAAVYDEVYENEFWGFREQLMPGCFTDTLEDCDCRALFNHDPNFVLGRTTSGTLKLEDSPEGLRFTVTPPDTQWARDLMVSLKRGDIDQCSFGFDILEQSVDKTDPNMPLFKLHKVRLWDVSPVTYPAYTTTSVEARAFLADLDIDMEELAMSVRQLRAGHGSDMDRHVVSQVLERLQSELPQVGEPGVHPEDGHVEQLQRMMIELDLL